MDATRLYCLRFRICSNPWSIGLITLLRKDKKQDIRNLTEEAEGHIKVITFSLPTPPHRHLYFANQTFISLISGWIISDFDWCKMIGQVKPQMVRDHTITKEILVP